MRIPAPCSAECFTRVSNELNAIKAAAGSQSSFDFARDCLPSCLLNVDKAR